MGRRREGEEGREVRGIEVGEVRRGEEMCQRITEAGGVVGLYTSLQAIRPHDRQPL
jgi:hypothetical protein